MLDTLEEEAQALRESAKTGGGQRLRCLPGFYLIGVTKSGTTDLYDKLLYHQDVVPPTIKEPMWWNRVTLGMTSSDCPRLM